MTHDAAAQERPPDRSAIVARPAVTGGETRKTLETARALA
jgi:hypothetical protein